MALLFSDVNQSRLRASAGHHVSAKPSTEVMMVRSLEKTEVRARPSGDDVLYWRSDIV